MDNDKFDQPMFDSAWSFSTFICQSTGSHSHKKGFLYVGSYSQMYRLKKMHTAKLQLTCTQQSYVKQCKVWWWLQVKYCFQGKIKKRACSEGLSRSSSLSTILVVVIIYTDEDDDGKYYYRLQQCT